MKVLGIFDRADGGGAAIAANRLLSGLEKLGAEVSRIVWCEPEEAIPFKTQCAALDSVPGGVERCLVRFYPMLEMAYLRKQRLLRRLVARVKNIRPDVISLHNIHGSEWPIEVVTACASRYETVWTLHDMWSFTGRCGYSHECKKYLNRCDESCPTPSEYPALSPALIGPAFDAKAQVLRNAKRLSAVTPSRWLALGALSGLWSDRLVRAIPNGIDLALFPKLDKAETRRKLGLPEDEIILLTVAQNLSEYRKGGSILPEVLTKFETKLKVRWILVGDCPPQGVYAFGKLDIRGVINSHARLQEFYRAADVMVHPAPSDNLPNVVVEAMAMELPILAFPVGGLPEMIQPGATGWLCESVGADSMISALGDVLGQIHAGVSLGQNCRRFVEDRFTVEAQARSYMELFEELLQRH